MKIGDRVQLSQAAIATGIGRRRHETRQGTIIRIRDGQGCADVLWDGLKYPQGYHVDFLTEAAERFPWRSHRTMAQVMADEQSGEAV